MHVKVEGFDYHANQTTRHLPIEFFRVFLEALIYIRFLDMALCPCVQFELLSWNIYICNSFVIANSFVLQD